MKPRSQSAGVLSRLKYLVLPGLVVGAPNCLAQTGAEPMTHISRAPPITLENSDRALRARRSSMANPAVMPGPTPANAVAAEQHALPDAGMTRPAAGEAGKP
jgi:hypothetical protein